MTINDAGLICELLRHNGWYPGDPQAFALYSYVNNWSKRTYALVYDDAGETSLLLAPAVHRPILLWAREAGITAAGQLLLTVNTLDPAIVHLDLNEGRQMDVGCVFCGTDVVATIGAAYPLRLYVVSLYCERCGQQLVTFGQFDQHMALITSAAGAR